MDRTAGIRFAHAASLSSTSTLPSSAALPALGRVVKTSSASVIPQVLARPTDHGAGSALLEPRQGGGDGAGSLQALLRHPADHLGPARREDAEPAAHGEPHQSAVQLDADLLVLVLRDDVLEEQ